MHSTKVTPLDAVTEQLINLSICDVYSPKVWVSQVHFWPLADSNLFERRYEILREALARTLTEIPALAGTLGRSSDDPRDLTITIDHDAHVDFGWEDLSGKDGIPTYAALKAAGFPMQGLIAPFSPPIALAPVSEGARMLTAKLSLLDGGLAFCFSFNHLLTDAASLAQVERIWALHANDISSGRKQTHRSNVTDPEIRKRLSTPVQDVVEEFADPNWKIFPTPHSQLFLPPEAVTKEAAMTMLHEKSGAQAVDSNGNAEETKWCMWYFGPEQLAQLKQDASGSDATQWISTMDALIGLFWSQLAFAKQESAGGHETSLMLFPINIRQRLQPPVDAQYVGNAVDVVMTECPLRDLEDYDAGLRNAARAVRRAVGGWSQAKWAAWQRLAAALPADQAICPNPLSLLGTRNLAFNDYSKSQSNTLDWGPELGRIDRTRYPKPAASLANCASAVVVHPRLADGGLEVAMTSTPRLRAALEGDTVFQRYGKLLCVYG